MIVKSEIICIPDSTVFVGDYHLRGPVFDSFKAVLLANNARLIVPEPVVLEVASHHRRDFKTALKKLHPLLDAVRQQGLSEQFPESGDGYEEQLRERLRQVGAEVISSPDVQPWEIFKRSLEGKKPFNESGHAGFKDQMIWECVKSIILSSSGSVYFVTGNSKDFSGDQKTGRELHHELASGLEGNSSTRVFLLPDLKTFRDEQLQNDVRVFERRSEVESPLRNFLSELLDGRLKEFDFKSGFPVKFAAARSIVLSEIRAVRSLVKVSEHRLVEEDVTRSIFVSSLESVMEATLEPLSSLGIDESSIIQSDGNSVSFVQLWQVEFVAVFQHGIDSPSSVSILKIGRVTDYGSMMVTEFSP